MRVLSLLLVFLLATGLLLAQKGTISDDQIFDDVRRRLANDPEVKGGRLEVEVKQGVVTLRGKVDKDKLKQKAERLAKKAKGVTQVINNLRVEP